jgi:hypothetical protein
MARSWLSAAGSGRRRKRRRSVAVAPIELSPHRLAGGTSTKFLLQFVITFHQKFDAKISDAHVINIYIEATVGNLKVVLRDNLLLA